MESYNEQISISDIENGIIISDEHSAKIVKVRQNLVVKYGKWIRIEEAEAINFVSENTSVPVPKIFNSYKIGDIAYIIMEYIKGKTLEELWEDLSNEERLTILSELKGYINQIRNIKGTYIGSVNKKPCIDIRRHSKEGGPFDTEAEFNEFIISRFHPRINKSLINIIRQTLRTDHKILFTHGDISPRNILIENGHIICILDWECAGFYPEYWEYIKSLHALNWDTDCIDYLPQSLRDESANPASAPQNGVAHWCTQALLLHFV